MTACRHKVRVSILVLSMASAYIDLILLYYALASILPAGFPKSQHPCPSCPCTLPRSFTIAPLYMWGQE